MNQITGERRKKKRITKGYTSTEWKLDKLQQRVKTASAIKKEKHTEKYSGEQQNKHYITQQV